LRTRADATASTNSVQVLKRSCGDFASARAKTGSSARGTSDPWWLMGGGGTLRCPATTFT